MESMLNNPRVNIETKKTINQTLTRGLKKRAYVIDSTPLIPSKFQGLKYITSRIPDDSEVEAFRLANYEPPHAISFYKRAVLNGSINYTREETHKRKETRFCDEYIYCKSIEYGRIVDIVTFRHPENTSISGFLIKKLTIVGNAFNTDHIHIVTESTKIFVAFTDNVLLSIVPAIILGKLSFDRLIISSLSNLNETD